MRYVIRKAEADKKAVEKAIAEKVEPVKAQEPKKRGRKGGNKNG